MRTQLLILLYRWSPNDWLPSKTKISALLVIGLMLLLSACSKEEGVYTEPNQSKFRIAFNSVSQEAIFDLYVDGKLEADSLRSFNNWVLEGKRHIQLARQGTKQYFLDSTITFRQPNPVSLTILDLDLEKTPILLPDDFLQTEAPQAGNFKMSLINTDATHIKNRIVDIAFYDLNEDFKFAGELTNVQPGKATGFIELIGDHAYVMEIKDHQTGEVLFSKDTFEAGALAKPGDANNVYLMKYYNTVPDPEVQGFNFYSAEPVVSTKL